jgi:Na+-translocating ferredoxin:NAD+ oxidoreductase subunit E
MIYEEIKRGVIDENPILVIALGLCPSLAISTSVQNGLGMGVAVTFVLACSNVIISLLRKVIPDKVRIPCFIIIIASFVSIVQLIMKAYLPALDKQLGIFVPLIVVNCIILGRAEAYASKNNVFKSLIDGLVMGMGYTVSLCIFSIIREILGSNKLFGLKFLPGYEPMTVFILAPGGFFTIACVMGIVKYLGNRKKGI